MNIPIRGINHVTFSVSDLDASAAFYESVFGSAPMLRTERVAYFEVGGLWLALNLQTGVPCSETTQSYTHVAFTLDVGDFERMARHLEHLGVPLRPSREREQGEGQSLYFADPDGHLLEFHTGDLKTRLYSYQTRLQQ